MRTPIWVILIGLIITIFVTIIIHIFSSDVITPKFIANSYDPNNKEEFDSILLKSLQKYIKQFFKDNGKAPITLDKEISSYKYDAMLMEDLNNTRDIDSIENFKNYETNRLKITNSTKISMYADNDKKSISILSVSNERDSTSQFEHKVGEIALHQIPMKIFLSKQIDDGYNLYENSIIKPCWSSKFHGKVLGAVSSTNKKQISVFYRITKGHTVSYRIRYFHNVSCDNLAIEKTDDEIEENYRNFFGSNNEFKSTKARGGDKYSNSDNYFEILEDINGGKNSENESNTNLPNYFNDDSYDDFALIGSTPIVAMTIKSNVIAYSRNVDYRQFYIIKREKRDDRRLWKVSLMGPALDKRVDNLFHTNSLKFIHDSNNYADYKLLQLFITGNNAGIQLNKNIISANHTDYSNVTQNDFYNTNVLKYSLNEEILKENINNYEEFNLDSSIKNLKDYMRPTIYSSSGSNKRITYEFTKGLIFYVAFSNDSNYFKWIQYKFNKKERVSKITADSSSENVIIKFENSNDLTYIFVQKEKENNITVEYRDAVKTINLKSLPKKYRGKEISALFVEKVEDKVILFLLNGDGIIISLDLTKHTENMKKNWLALFITELNYTASIIIIANIITISFYFHLRNRRRHFQSRTTEINQVVQDIIRLNNIQMTMNNNFVNGLNNQESQNNAENIPNNTVINSENEVNAVNEAADNNALEEDNNLNLNGGVISQTREDLHVNETDTNIIQDNVIIGNAELDQNDNENLRDEIYEGR